MYIHTNGNERIGEPLAWLVPTATTPMFACRLCIDFERNAWKCSATTEHLGVIEVVVMKERLKPDP